MVVLSQVGRHALSSQSWLEIEYSPASLGWFHAQRFSQSVDWLTRCFRPMAREMVDELETQSAVHHIDVRLNSNSGVKEFREVIRGRVFREGVGQISSTAPIDQRLDCSQHS